MLRVVSQAIPPDNGEPYRRAVAQACAALERAIAVTVPVDASFADREVGERNGPTIVPLDVTTGLIEGATLRWPIGWRWGMRRGPGATRRSRCTRSR